MNNKKKVNHFNQFISELRAKKNISIERLCEGLCTSRMAWYLEKGERTPDKLLQDCILERLGIGAEDYEHFLYYYEEKNKYSIVVSHFFGSAYQQYSTCSSCNMLTSIVYRQH